MLGACSSGADKSDGPVSPADAGAVDDGSDDGGTATDTGDGETGPMWPGADWVEADPADHGLDPAALDELASYTFRDSHNTQALVVFKDGYLVAEWYAEGADADSLVTSWSMAKSVTSALVGVGIREGALSLDDTVGQHLSEWATGPNAGITLHHLLTMQSGLPENWSNPYGVYGAEPDQLAYSLDREPVRPPGEQYSYVNEDSMVVGGVLAAALGQPVADVARTELFEPLGLSADWWVDGVGNTLTYCCLDSTARDFGRFGLLYARGGEWDGAQLIPADYLAESTSGQSYDGAYGLHWWIDSERDAFAGIGLSGQYVWVKPDADLVVVRFGTYERIGTEPVRTGRNYHDTEDSGGLRFGVFATLIERALVVE